MSNDIVISIWHYGTFARFTGFVFAFRALRDRCFGGTILPHMGVAHKFYYPEDDPWQPQKAT